MYHRQAVILEEATSFIQSVGGAPPVGAAVLSVLPMATKFENAAHIKRAKRVPTLGRR
jgi:hypothetical protein